MRCALIITAAALAASKESDTDAAYKRSRLVYEAKKNEPFALVFENPYAEPRELYWIGAGSEPSLMGTVEPGGEFNVNTYEGHAFGWRPPAQSETCTTDELEGTVHAARGMERHVFGEKPRVLDAHARKREQERDDPFEAHFTNRAAYAMRLTDTKNASRTVDVAPGATRIWSVRRGEHYDWTSGDGELLYRSVIEFYDQKKHDFKEELHTALCAEKTPPSEPVRVAEYHDEFDGRDLQVEILREEPLIAYLPNWTKPGDCADMEGRALRIGLADAQVFGERNVIADRRAISANLEWSRSNETSITNHLIKRAFKLAENLRSYDVTPGPFQEPLNFIQYAHGGEYRPHCDGVCHRTPYARGGRVATLIHYCRAPEVGGATVFPKARLKVQPQDDSAVLFTYKQSDGFMDDGNTLHTGCLLREGVKQIVTMWMREDVHDGEPWSDFLS